MVTGSLTSKLRPIRIGFVISPWDRAAALEAMRISSFLWGGTYNPIIPYHQRLDRRSRFFMGAKSAQEVFDGYLQAYDPDFVVRLGAAKNTKVNLGTYREIEGDTILGGVSDDGTPRYGVPSRKQNPTGGPSSTRSRPVASVSRIWSPLMPMRVSRRHCGPHDERGTVLERLQAATSQEVSVGLFSWLLASKK